MHLEHSLFLQLANSWWHFNISVKAFPSSFRHIELFPNIIAVYFVNTSTEWHCGCDSVAVPYEFPVRDIVCDGEFKVSTWLDHGVPRYLAQHYFCEGVSEWDWHLNQGTQKRTLPFPMCVGITQPTEGMYSTKGRRENVPLTCLFELRHQSSPALR